MKFKAFSLLTVFLFFNLNSLNFDRSLIDKQKDEIVQVIFKNNVLRKLTYLVGLPFLTKICYETLTGKQIFTNKLEIINKIQSTLSSGLPLIIVGEILSKLIKDILFVEFDLLWISKETQIFELLNRFKENILAVRNSSPEHLQYHTEFLGMLFDHLKLNSAKIIAFIENKVPDIKTNDVLHQGLAAYSRILFTQLSGQNGYIFRIESVLEKLKSEPDKLEKNLDELEDLAINLSTCFDALKFSSN